MSARLIFAIVLGVQLFTDAVVVAQIPQWALTHKHHNYPTGEYILGVGYGTGEKPGETAKRLAQSDIAAQVRVKVQTEIKNVQQTYELNQNQETYADFKIKSTSIVDEELTGAEIVETSMDSSTNTMYALAALNKAKFAGAIAAELLTGWNQAGELHAEAQDFLKQGKLNETVQNLLEARTITTNLLPKQALYDAVAAAPHLGQPSLGPSALTSSIRDALSKVRIEKKSGDNQKGKIGEKFPEPFVVQVSIADNEKLLHAVGVAVAFVNVSGEPLGEAIADANGVAAFSAQVRASIGSQVRARLSLPSTGREFASNLNSSSVLFTCAVLDANVAFAVKIEVTVAGANEVLRSVVSSAVTQVGYHIVDMSRFVLNVQFQSAPPTLIDGMGGTLFSVSSDMTIVLADKVSSRLLGSVSAKSKAVAKTREDALVKSARDLKINEQDLVSLLERAKN
jgi:LPP20 lipoprotein